ncbi:sugar phosphate isomerase/epimerase family protein [Actinoplanes sp. URMC 104]|uniref:sugar phosphate isomerase/epimerase family protein n=1 Tax=Actinoplanes sp. URMC 104 TaxID=3423409 RepID=UPI003F1C8BF2
MDLGTTTFSLTPLWRFGSSPVEVFEQIARAGCGPAIEVIGHQTWRGFPGLDPADERDWHEAVDRLGLRPAALGVYTDLYRHPGRALTEDEAYDELLPQLETAARLGFPVVRATLGMTPGLLRRAVAAAEKHDVVLTLEIQGTTAPDAPAVLDVLRTESAHLGFTLDFSLSTPELPASLGTALLRLGLPGDAVDAVYRARFRMGEALGIVAGDPMATMLVAGVLGRCGRTRPGDWAHVLPAVRHAHAKFWDPDLSSIEEPHRAWMSALAAAGYDGAVVSEWGGHELLDRADADPVELTRAHLGLLREPAVTA